MPVDTLQASLLDALHAHVALVDADGVITAVNEPWCRFASDNAMIDRSAGVGTNYLDLCDRARALDNDARKVADGLRGVLSGHTQSFEHEYPCHGPDEQRWYRLQVGAFVDVDGRRGAVLAHENITTLKLSEQRLLVRNAGVQAELDKARAELVRHTRLVTIGQVAASIAHELRNPLGAIRNAAYLLKRKSKGGDESLERYVDIIEAEVSSSDQIIGDLMAMARGRAPERERIAAGRLIRDAITRVPGLPADGVSVAFEPDEAVELLVDAGQLEQVLINLIANATQACERADRPTRVHVGVAATSAAAEIRVSDAGEGIPPEFQHRVFEPMFSTRVKGTGLGLAICRQVIESHNGSIHVNPSRAELGGAEFVVRLPGPTPAPPTPPVAPGPNGSGPTGSGPNGTVLDRAAPGGAAAGVPRPGGDP